MVFLLQTEKKVNSQCLNDIVLTPFEVPVGTEGRVGREWRWRWNGEVERQRPEVVAQGPVLALSRRKGRVLRERGREESKPQLEEVFVFVFVLSVFLFFKWKQDYRTLSPTEGIFHLLLSD
jgi:hypothetical protein